MKMMHNFLALFFLLISLLATMDLVDAAAKKTTKTTTTKKPTTTTTTAASSGGGSSSGGSSSSSSAPETLILNCHNAYRSSLAQGTAKNKTGTMPAGSNILQLKYSSTVASVAQAWADKCTMEHSGGSYGECLYMSSDASLSKSDALQQACDAWWGELTQTGMSSNLQFTMSVFNSGIGHWSQLAWASTANLGCAVASCPNSQWQTYVVCNYDPPGNFLGENIYEKGTACSACPSGSSCNSSSGLCA